MYNRDLFEYMYSKGVNMHDIAFRYGVRESEMLKKLKAKITQEQKYIYMEVIDDIYKWRLSRDRKEGGASD